MTPAPSGIRLSAPRTLNAYQSVMYGKGAYVLQMLRSLMSDPHAKNPDAAFMAMMHEFVESHRDQPATTESFKKVAEKHITKVMDLQGNGSLDWFFDEWVYGTQVPRYRFDYQIASGEAGKTTLHLSITQIEVDAPFVMLVPVFADFGHGMQRLGQVAVAGNSTRNFDVVVPQKPNKVALNVYKDILER
jgi:aminopeptidase N